MRAFTAAALQLAPSPEPLSRETISGNCRRAVEWVRRCVDATGAELVVLPESASTGFSPGCGPDELWDLVDVVPGALTEPLQEAARATGAHLVWGTYERGPQRGVVFNSSVLITPDGEVAGVYRKTHPFCTEIVTRGGWVTPGDEVCVVDTDLGRIGMAICFDGDFPELWRIQAVLGAGWSCARPRCCARPTSPR
jgi:predicted amidohydrolase